MPIHKYGYGSNCWRSFGNDVHRSFSYLQCGLQQSENHDTGKRFKVCLINSNTVLLAIKIDYGSY